MGTPEAYRKRAKECVELAQRVTPFARPDVLAIAEAWLRLAEQADQEAMLLDADAPQGRKQNN